MSDTTFQVEPTEATKNMPKIQAAIKCPKGRQNDFGGFNYRNAEDILEAAKPVLAEHGASIKLTDSIKVIGDRFYIIATAVLTFSDGSYNKAKGYAREPQEKRGMDEAQVTGASSSYARKYALNGLFALDDGRDADSIEPPEPISEAVIDDLQKMVDKLDEEGQENFNVWIHDTIGVDSIHDLDVSNVKRVESALKKSLKAKNK